MSEKSDAEQQYEDDDQDCANASPVELPDHQYTKDQLITISESPASQLRPPCLDKAYDTKEGRWDPEAWWCAKFGSRESSPLTLGDGKERRRIVELDRDLKRRTSAIDPVERLKEERDGIVLSPQRRSFVTGCHVQNPGLSYSRQLSLPERDRDREDPRLDRDRERDRDRGERERDRDRPLRKIGSGRIQIDREGTRDFSNLRDRFDDRDRDRDRDRDHPWNRDRSDRDRDWDRDRDSRDSDWDRDRDRRFDRGDRSDRLRRINDNQYSDRDRTRDRDFRDRDRDRERDRAFERPGRRRNNYSREEEKEPEWFTGGPTSQMDTIELRGFEAENHKPSTANRSKKSEAYPEEENHSEKLDAETTEANHPASMHPPEISHTGDNEVERPKSSQEHPVSYSPQMHLHRSLTPQQAQQSMRLSPLVAGVEKQFDLDEILKAHLPMTNEGEVQGSRFSRFFAGPTGSMIRSQGSSMDNILMPHDLLEDGRHSPMAPSPSSHLLPGPGGLLPRELAHMASAGHFGGGEAAKALYAAQGFPPGSIPNSAGDNNVGMAKPTLTAPVTALFNSAMAGGANASAMSSNGSFSSQDAEAQLKAMLFGGGHRESVSSSGTASPASLKPNSSKRVKTLAEVEADMHQNSPKKTTSPVQSNTSSGGNAKVGDLAAFNKLLTLISAASESGQTSSPSISTTPSGHGYIPSNSEFAHALKRNKEHQMLLQQSAQTQPPPPLPLLQGARQGGPEMMQVMPAGARLPFHPHLADGAILAAQHKAMAGGMPPPPPQAASTPLVQQNPHAASKQQPRIQAVGGGSNPSNDPIFSLIQQNPAILMKQGPPSPSVAALLTSTAQQQPPIAATNARIPSPLIFSQQPPLHLSAPSPINPTQLGTSLAVNNLPASSGLGSPVQRVLSPQSISMQNQAMMQNALIKKQLQNQNERYIKKQMERSNSPSQQQQQQQHQQQQQQHITVVKSQPAAQPVLPPNPQPKGATLDTFTPTSVLRKMHSDRAIEKEKQSQGADGEEPLDYMPSMQELSNARPASVAHSQSENLSVDNEGGREIKAGGGGGHGEASDISFLNPINPNLVNLTNQLEGSLKFNPGQINILPGSLSQPMSVEEKMKLSSLVEKRGNLGQILESKPVAEAGLGVNKMVGMQGRPIVRGSERMAEECPPPQPRHVLPHQSNLMLQQQQQQQMLHHHHHHHQQQQQQQHVSPLPPGARAVTGGGMKMQGAQFGGALSGPEPPMSPAVSSQPPIVKGLGVPGRAIVGSTSVQQLPPMPMNMPPPPGTALSPEMMRMLEQQKQQQQHQQLQQHFQRAQQPMSQGSMVAPPPMTGPMPFAPAHVGVSIATRMPMAGIPVHDAASAALIHQQMARDGPMMPSSSSSMGMNGNSSRTEIGTSIQRWFSADILKNQLPSMPPLPTQGSHVLTVDELERT